MLKKCLPLLSILLKNKLFYFILLTAFIVLVGIYFPFNQKATGQSPVQSCPTCSQPASRMIYAPIIELPEAESSDIVLNCRSPHEMEAVPTFYTADGAAIVGETIHLRPSEMRFVTVESLIPAEQRGQHIWGGMSLSYTGRLMEVWAQITLRGRGQHGSSDVTFAVLNKAGAATQEAVWWMPPSGTAVVALGNSADTPIHTALQFSNGEKQELDIAPFATGYVRHNADSNREKSADTGFAEAVKIVTSGPAGSLKVAGYVTSGSNNFTSSIRFYETPNAVQEHLFATNLKVRNAATHLLLKNTSTTTLTAKPHFLTNDGIGAPVTIPAATLAPGEIKEIDLKPLAKAVAVSNDSDQMSVSIENSGAPGSLIGALYSTNQETDVTSDIPLRDTGGLRNSTGAYPWRLDDDYKTIVSVTNVGHESTEFSVAIHYDDGRYMFKMRELAAGQTAVYDLRQLRDEQIPDQNGNVIPIDVTSGQFRWSVTKRHPSTARLIGRSEVISRSGRVSISYSCPMCCPENGPYFDGWQLFQTGVGEFSSFREDGYWYDCYGYSYGPSGFLYAVNSNNTSVAQISLPQQYGGLEMEGISPGETGWLGDYYFSIYYSDDISCIDGSGYTNTGGDMAVVPTVASITATIPSTKNPVANTRPTPVTFNTTNNSTAFATGTSPTNLLVTFQSSDANLTVTATGIIPTTAASSLQWKIDRDPNDTGLSGTPTLSTQTGVTLTITPNTSGNFRLICYYDANGNSSYDSGEEIKTLRLAIVQTTISSANDCRFIHPSASSTFTGAQNAVSTTNAMSLTCTVILQSGGTNRQVGLDEVHLGNVGNLTIDNFTVDYPVPTPTPPSPGNQTATEYEAPNGRAMNSSDWFPLPMVDTSLVSQGNEPTGAGTSFRYSSSQVSSSNTGGGQTSISFRKKVTSARIEKSLIKKEKLKCRFRLLRQSRYRRKFIRF